jgi:hypothetical protein
MQPEWNHPACSPCGQVIAAANAALEGRYERQMAAGFREMAARLAAANAAIAAAAAGGAPAARAGGAPSEVEDAYSLLSLLRRLALWPVSVQLLRSTAVGKEVAALRRHSCLQVHRPHPCCSQLNSGPVRIVQCAIRWLLGL